MATTTGGYPSLETVANLMRVFLNDWQPGVNGVPGEGQISTDDPTRSPQTLQALNSAIREVYRELRNVGDPTLIRDNVLVNLPALAASGAGIQAYLSRNGYFDGVTLQVTPVLPPDLMFPVELWEQQTGSALPFIIMTQPQSGLPSVQTQGFNLGVWEWREDRLNFVGALVPITIRIRYLAALGTYVSPVDYPNVTIPIMDCEEAIAYKAAYKIACAISGIQVDTNELKQNAMDAMQQLKNETVRRSQTVEYQRLPYSFGNNPAWGSGFNTGGVS